MEISLGRQQILTIVSVFQQHINSSCSDYVITKISLKPIYTVFIKNAQIIDGLLCSDAGD